MKLIFLDTVQCDDVCPDSVQCDDFCPDAVQCDDFCTDSVQCESVRTFVGMPFSVTFFFP